jgi:hypothetical protein
MAQNRQAAGTSDPLDFRNARTLGRRPGSVPSPETNLYGGNLATNDPGTAFTNGDAVTAEVAIAGALLIRIRGLFTGGGTISLAYLRPAASRPADPAAAGYAYTADPAPHADVDVTADTEFSFDINPGGESDLLVTFTPSADGVVTFLDVMQQ